MRFDSAHWRVVYVCGRSEQVKPAHQAGKPSGSGMTLPYDEAGAGDTITDPRFLVIHAELMALLCGQNLACDYCPDKQSILPILWPRRNLWITCSLFHA